MEKISEQKKTKTAHSNVRKGISDYNDGSSLNHYLGNDDYHFGNNEADPYHDGAELDGSVAFGNDLDDEDDFDEEEIDEHED